MKYLLYIGNNNPCEKKERFVLEVEEERYQKAQSSDFTFRGKVIAKNKDVDWSLGYISDYWVNPFFETRKGKFCCFVIVSKEWVQGQTWDRTSI